MDKIQKSWKVAHWTNSGSWAVHTTGFNISSEGQTVDRNPNTVIFRRNFIQAFADWVVGEGHQVESLDFSLGNCTSNFIVDLPPYRSEPHIRLFLHGYGTTSIGLIVRKRKTRSIVGKWFEGV